MKPSQSYLIYIHANGNENLYRVDENYFYYLKLYQKYTSNIDDTLAYCLMPNHLHLLVKIKEEEALKSFFKIKYPTKDLTGFENLSGLTIRQFSHLFNAYAKAYNKMYQRRGSLFTRAFRRIPITTDDYFSTIIRYIHANPVHHGFVKHISNWPFSSYQSIANNENSFLDSTSIINWFGSQQEFINFHQQAIPTRSLAKIHLSMVS